MKTRNLFTLLIGINDYDHIRSLNGPESDVDLMLDYLNNYASKDFKIFEKRLLSEYATKANIVNDFYCHLIRDDKFKDQAAEIEEFEIKPQKGDVALFYYSGHGGQQFANPVFQRYEADGMLECLACRDSDPSTGENLLADKELRWLIHKLEATGVEVVCIFDCCHAGDNTRFEGEPDALKIERRIAEKAPVRDWDGFIFSEDIREDDFKNKSLQELIPEGKHIQLAACEDYESAYDINGGVFTKQLIKVLKRLKGDVSYFDLIRQVRNSFRDTREQTPLLYVFGKDESIVFDSFLSGLTKDKPQYNWIQFNRNKRHWEIDAGGLDGLKTFNPDGEPTSVLVRFSENETGLASVKKVFSTYAVLEFEPYAPLSKQESYMGSVSGLNLSNLYLCVDGDDEGKTVFTNYYKNNEEDLKKDKIFLVKEEFASYRLVAKNNEFLISDNFDRLHRPLIKQVEGYGLGACLEIKQNLLHISRWLAQKEIFNPNTSIRPKAPIDLQLTYNGELVKPDKKGRLSLHYTDNLDSEKPFGEFKASIKNKSEDDLFVACLYLSSLFGIIKALIPQDTVRLISGEPAYEIYNGEKIKFSRDAFITDYNWKTDKIWLLIISSVSDFKEKVLNVTQKNLKPAERLYPADKSGMIDQSDFFRGTEVEDDWTSQLITITIPNPDYKA